MPRPLTGSSDIMWQGAGQDVQLRPSELGCITVDSRFAVEVAGCVAPHVVVRTADTLEEARAVLQECAVTLVDGLSLRLVSWAPALLRANPAPDQVVVIWQRLDGAGSGEFLRCTLGFRNQLRELLAIFSHLTPRARERDAADILLGRGEAMASLRDHVRRVSSYRDLAVFVHGETGTGKELVAQAIHDLTFGTRAPMVAVNCAAIPETLFESELFGHEAGAFSGARGRRPGLLEHADGGTLFLDEVGELPTSLQPKLLRVIESRLFRPVGSNVDRPLRARIVSATHRVPAREPNLRRDLLFRLAGFTISIPPLRQRMEDIDLLANSFLRRFAERNAVRELELEPSALSRLRKHTWPGNLRELRSVIEAASVLARGPTIGATEIDDAIDQGAMSLGTRDDPRTLATGTRSSDPRAFVDSNDREAPASSVGISRTAALAADASSLEQAERELMISTFMQESGNLSAAARRLRLARSTLRDRLRRYGVL